jgi:uncharacterized protein YndB with AHSA1/START domain
MQTTIDEGTYTISFERKLAGTCEDVWAAWTRPDEIAEWWDPTGARLVACEVDLRVGGAFRFVNAGHAPPFTGTYRTVERPTRLVFDAVGALGTVTLDAAGAGTRMRVTIRCASKQHLEQLIALGVASNTDLTFDNLVAHVAGRVAQRSSH